MSYKLFIPGPIAVSEKTLRAMSQPMIGHRSTDFVALYNTIQPELQALMYTRDPVYISTSSAWGVMEGSLRNVVQKKVLNCMNGAFSDKWNDVALRDAKQATALKFDWGQPVDPEAVRRELAKGGYDAITLIHNETSCGCMSDLAAIMTAVRAIPEVISVVETGSSFPAAAPRAAPRAAHAPPTPVPNEPAPGRLSPPPAIAKVAPALPGVASLLAPLASLRPRPIKKEDLGVDFFITGSQNAPAPPPGLS